MILPPLGPELDHTSTEPVRREEDVKFAAGKIALFQYVTVGIFLFLITGFWELQIRNPQFYNELAEKNRIKFYPIPAPRGKILDRDGRVIVDNHSSFSLILSRENLKMEHLKPIAEGLGLDYDDLAAKVIKYRSRPSYEAIVVKDELTPAELSFVESHRDFFPEMDLIHSQRRLYPQNGFAAHVIGYTGEISESELDDPAFAKYSAGDVIGKFGVEREYNDTLMGVDGQRQVMVDNMGRVRQQLGIKDAIPGKDLQLTIDLDLQAVAELAMEGKKGAVVALDPRTGEVLAMVSRPAFDPNKFAVRIKPADWKEIADNPDHPLLNRAIQAQFAPGSTFKPLMALAGLDSKTIDDQWTVNCPGGATFYGHYFKCWVRGGHGRVNLHAGIVHSCDVYFYNVGNKMGIDKIAFYADQAGFGHRSGVDLPHEVEGVVPSAQWKMRNFRQKWYAGETISVSIGQGALTVTPIQLARAIGGISVGGVWHVPHLLKNETGKDKPHTYHFNPEDVADVLNGMWGVVNEAGGTGPRARIPGEDVCGKTGSAQLASNAFLKGQNKKSMKDNAWFVGLAPRDNPEIVVAVLFENGEHGYLAAPIARDVMKAYFDKKARLASELKGKEAASSARMQNLNGLGLPTPKPAPPQPAAANPPRAVGAAGESPAPEE